MMFQSTNALHQLPFKDIYLHALVKDEQGRKMSKRIEVKEIEDMIGIIKDIVEDLKEDDEIFISIEVVRDGKKTV